jgi:2-oxoisovalerate dehydrogenase E1 component alpha subunit
VTTAGSPGAQDPVARSGLPRDRLVGLYRLMALARALDERAWILNRSGRVHFVISGQGHEGAEAGVTAALTPGRDWLLPYYRSMTGVMAMGMTPREVFLHQFGKADDPGSGGRQMPSHYGHAGHRIFTSSSPVATQVLHAAGIALAAKLRGVREVALVAMGEGSANQGDVHEALNFAGIHRLPMILLVENNGYAISVPAELETAVRDLAVRAAGYAMPGVVVDGSDVIGCYLAARDAVARALAGEGPTFIEAKVMRLTGHSSDDQQTRYRSAEELAAELAQDPLPRFRDELRAAGVLSEAAEAALAAEVAAAVDDATEFAEAAPDPDPSTLLAHVYAEPGDPVTGPPPAHPAGGVAFNSTPVKASPPDGNEANAERKVPALGDGSGTLGDGSGTLGDGSGPSNATSQPADAASRRGVAFDARAPRDTHRDPSNAPEGPVGAPGAAPSPAPGGPA